MNDRGPLEIIMRRMLIWGRYVLRILVKVATLIWIIIILDQLLFKIKHLSPTRWNSPCRAERAYPPIILERDKIRETISAISTIMNHLEGLSGPIPINISLFRLICPPTIQVCKWKNTVHSYLSLAFLDRGTNYRDELHYVGHIDYQKIKSGPIRIGN